MLICMTRGGRNVCKSVICLGVHEIFNQWETQLQILALPSPLKIAMVYTCQLSNLDDIRSQNSLLLYHRPFTELKKKKAHRLASTSRYLRYLLAEARRCAIFNSN